MPKNVECHGCNMMFVSKSAMVLHLETGTCASGVDRTWVTRTGGLGKEAFRFINAGLGFDFKCPNCPTQFQYMSGLLQHAESPTCQLNLEHLSLHGFLFRLRDLLRELRQRTGADQSFHWHP